MFLGITNISLTHFGALAGKFPMTQGLPIWRVLKAAKLLYVPFTTEEARKLANMLAFP